MLWFLFLFLLVFFLWRNKTCINISYTSHSLYYKLDVWHRPVADSIREHDIYVYICTCMCGQIGLRFVLFCVFFCFDFFFVFFFQSTDLGPQKAHIVIHLVYQKSTIHTLYVYSIEISCLLYHIYKVIILIMHHCMFQVFVIKSHMCEGNVNIKLLHFHSSKPILIYFIA